MIKMELSLRESIGLQRLITKAKVYKSQGLQDFPKGWHKLCRALTILTGKKFP